ncbi:MAG: VOC family protein [Saprospiraceae bacterium]
MFAHLQKLRGLFYCLYYFLEEGVCLKLLHFYSYFLSFDMGCRLELMHKPDILQNKNIGEYIGIIHFAISVGSKGKVDSLTEILRQANYKIVGEPRTTGDGYYESVVLDPEGNRIEITV